MNNCAIDNGWMREMFDSVPRRYRLLNKILTFGQDESWRQRALEMIKVQAGDKILDVCTGTADLALKIARMFPWAKIHAIDFSLQMLAAAKKRIEEGGLKNIIIQEKDCIDLGFDNEHFDYITISFGFRNISYSRINLIRSLKEMYRVLKPEGQLIILETSQIYP